MFGRNPREELEDGIRSVNQLTRYVIRYLDSPRSRTIAVACFLVVGLGLILSGFLVYRAGERFGAQAERADAEVISTTRRPFRDNHGTQQYTNDPVVRFRTATGVQITATVTRTSQVSTYSIGQRIRVLYDPAQPSAVEIAGDANAWMLPLILFAAGGAVLVAGGGLLRISLRDRSEQAGLSGRGQRVEAKVVSIRRTEMAEGPPVWSVEAEWTDPSTGRVMVFRSKEVREDPAALHGVVTIVFDPANPRQYHMESRGIGIY